MHAGDLGEEHEEPRTDEDRHLRRQRVVVAERDLVGRRRVVLVDDRYCPDANRASSACVRDVCGTIGQVADREQHLRGEEIFARERAFPGALEPTLAERGCGLELRHRARAAVESQLRKSSAIAPDETTATGSPLRTTRAISRARGGRARHP